MIIRPMQLADIPLAHEIDTLSFTLPWPERSFRFELQENRFSRCWVMEPEMPLNGISLAGMAVSWLLVDELHIATIAVHPQYRGLGLGKRLLAHVLQDGADQGMVKAVLEVRIGNIIAQNLYHQFGFVTINQRPKYYQDNLEDALTMAANLPVRELLS